MRRRIGRCGQEFQVVDYWHSCKHMGTASEEIFPHDSSARRKWYTKYRRLLRDEPEGVEMLIRSLRYYYDRSGKQNTELKEELSYVRNHRDRMNYKRHRDQKLPIGSGVTESAGQIGGSADRSRQSLTIPESVHANAVCVGSRMCFRRNPE